MVRPIYSKAFKKDRTRCVHYLCDWTNNYGGDIMTYETIKACLDELKRRGIIHPAINRLMIDGMYAILREIGYTMCPITWYKREPHEEQSELWYIPAFKPLDDTELQHPAAIGEDDPGCVPHPEECFKPAFIAAINHYLESNDA